MLARLLALDSPEQARVLFNRHINIKSTAINHLAAMGERATERVSA